MSEAANKRQRAGRGVGDKVQETDTGLVERRV